MKYSILKTIGLAVILSASSCKKDPSINSDNPLYPIIPPNTDCNLDAFKSNNRTEHYGELYFGTTTPPCTAGPQFRLTGKYSYKNNCVNPRNKNEFAFLRWENNMQAGDNSDLCVYNMCSNTLKIIANQVAYSLDWSVKDWIIYTGSDRNLWKIKSNGDSLTQLTFTGPYNNNAKWNLDGTKYLYAAVASGEGMRISNSDGTLHKLVLYSTTGGIQSWDWLNNEEIIFTFPIPSSATVIKKYNVNTDEVTQLQSVSVIGSGHTQLNVVDNTAYFHTSNGSFLPAGLYKLDLLNNNLTLLDKIYPSYRALFLEPVTSDLILLNRLINDTTGFDSCIVYRKRHLAIFNWKTKEERKLQLPE